MLRAVPLTVWTAASRLAAFRWPAPEGYNDFADRNVMVITVIEEARAVERAVRLTVEAGVLTRDVSGDPSCDVTTGAVTERIVSHVVAAEMLRAGEFGRVRQHRDEAHSDR